MAREVVRESSDHSLGELGRQLRETREERKLSLKEVENGTSIRMSYLQAIESGNLEGLIPAVYARGFIKQYGAFIGLDGEELLRGYGGALEGETRQEFTYGIGTLEMRTLQRGGSGWMPNTLWLVAFGGLILLGWYSARLLDIL